MKSFLIGVLLFVGIVTGACAQKAPPEGWRAITISTAPEAPTKDGIGAKYGELIFRGGLQLKSGDAKFGGWSGARIDKDGRLIALSDQGSWLSLRLDLDPQTGVLIGVSDAKMAPLRDLDGSKLQNKEYADSEGLARLPDGRFAVSFERHHRIWFYDLDGAGPSAAPTPGPPVRSADLADNQGLEAVTAGPDGELVAGSEIAPPGEKTSRFYVYKLGAPPEKALIALGPAQVSQGNSLVDMDMLPDGDIVALERFYMPMFGYRTAIRRYQIAGLAEKTPILEGPLLASFASPQNLDNFEGLAVQALPDGATRLYIISDDNFSPTQKTMLYAFDLPAPVKAADASEPAGRARSR